MDLYARVNILDGRSVRLPRGDIAEAILLDNDPVARAQSWARQGVDYIHVVDLDAAANGDFQNRPLIDRLIAECSRPVQVAGGVRSPGEAARLVEAGAWRVVMGTAAIEDQNLIWELCRDYPGKMVVSIDVRPDEEIATRGWTKNSGRYLEEVLIEMSSAGVTAFLVAEAGRDALAEPPDFDLLRTALASVDDPIIASGGVRDLADLTNLIRLEANGRRLSGVIVGREVTHGRFTIEEAKRVVAGEGPALPPGRIIGLRTLLRVSDFARSAAFYEKTLGFRRITSWERDHGSGVVLEAAGGETLELLGPPSGETWEAPTGVHLGFFVEDVQGWHDHLVDVGVPITRELRQEAWGDVVFGVDDPDGVKVWFGQTPD